MSLLLLFFNDTATTEIYTLSLHDALPICPNPARMSTWSVPSSPRTRFCCGKRWARLLQDAGFDVVARAGEADDLLRDRKSTRLNSSHANISYAVFCLKIKRRLMLVGKKST